MKHIILPNTKFNLLTTISYDKNKHKWYCVCDCKTYCHVSSANLVRNSTKSCGCLRESIKKHLQGKKFNYLTVLEKDVKKSTSKRIYWICKCDCGNIKSMRGDSITDGTIKSCGCYNKKVCQEYKNLTGTISGYWTVISHDEAKYCLCKCKCGTIKKVKTQGIVDKTSKSCGCWHIEVATKQIDKVHRDRKIERGLNPDFIYSTENEQIRTSLKPLSKLIRIRDKYTCQLCHKIGGNLPVHHIEKFSIDIENRGNPNNMITLCDGCHKKAHKNNFFGDLDIEIQNKLKERINNLN